jgi:hypothetical protein
VIAFGLRLTLRGGREAVLRLAVIAVAVALGTGLLLTTLAGINAVNTQNGRFAWLETDAGAVATAQRTTADPVWWRLVADEFDGKVLGRVDVAATGPHSPVPPGMSRLPAAGEYFASPSLARLISSTPAAELAARYPGRLAGTIDDAALPAPDSLIIVIGQTPAQMAQLRGAIEVTAISTTAPNHCNGACYNIGYNDNSIDLILAVVSAAMLFPILVFIGTATRLSAARREQRFAAMRLVGATPRQIAVISTVESTVAATLGVLAGFGLFVALRPSIAKVPFTGSRFFVSDLALSVADVLLVGLGIPIAAAVAATLGLRRVIISPLGVTRRVTPIPPRAWRLVPLLAGLGELALLVHTGRPATTGGQTLVYTAGILITMFGLVLAGPWITMTASRAVARRARRPAALVAARRLADDPKAGFRAISGLVLGLFVATVAIALITTITFYNGAGGGQSEAERGTLVSDLLDFSGDPPRAEVQSVPVDLQQRLAALPGVLGQVSIHEQQQTFGPGPAAIADLAACSELNAIKVFGHCAPGAQTAYAEPGFGKGSDQTGRLLPTAPLTRAQLAGLPISTFAVRTDGSIAAIERTRTVMEAGLPKLRDAIPMTLAEQNEQSSNSQRTRGYEQLALVVEVASLAIAGCTLAVSVVTGLNDRRRPFGLLRLTGAPLAVLRRVVALETAVPLLAGAAVSIGAGFLASYLFLRSQLTETLRPPGLNWYVVTASGLIAAFVIVASTLPVLERITGPEAVRTD